MKINPNSPVAIKRCEKYNAAELAEIIEEMLDSLDVAHMFDGKRVAIKPNLVMKASPDRAATTHPAVLEAVISVLRGRAADIVIAESPGGLYTEQALRAVYRTCGIYEVAERCGVKLNFDTTSKTLEAKEGKASKLFDIITPIADADVIVNLAKLKSHALTGYSGAVKNYFGTVPGVAKFEMHARFPDYNDFGSMLADLCAMHISSKPTFNLLDGIVAMEGNGPTGGTPRKLNCLLASVNPFCVDVAGASIIGVGGVIMLDEGIRRGYCPGTASELNIISDEPLSCFAVEDFVKPDTARRGGSSLLAKLPTMFGGRLNSWLQPRPVIDTKKCVGCGECERSCPGHTIEIRQKGNGKKQGFIIDDRCIKCYCCQELCPFKAVKIKKNFIIKLIGG